MRRINHAAASRPFPATGPCCRFSLAITTVFCLEYAWDAALSFAFFQESDFSPIHERQAPPSNIRIPDGLPNNGAPLNKLKNNRNIQGRQKRTNGRTAAGSKRPGKTAGSRLSSHGAAMLRTGSGRIVPGGTWVHFSHVVKSPNVVCMVCGIRHRDNPGQIYA